MVKLNARCSAVLQNELPPKEKDPGSFILPCAIGTTTLSKAVADLGESISIMHFPCLSGWDLGTPNQSICLSEINELYEPKDLEELLLSNDDLDIFLNNNDLLPNLESHDNMLLLPTGSTRDLTYEGTKYPVKPEFLNSSNIIHLHGLYNLQITCKIGFVNFDPYIKTESPFNIMSQKAYNSIMKHELEFTWNNMVGFARNLHVFIESHQFLIDFIILENINKFVEERLTEVLFGQPFKEHIGIIDDTVNGILWFKIGDDKTIFNMPCAEKRFVSAVGTKVNAAGYNCYNCLKNFYHQKDKDKRKDKDEDCLSRLLTG
ncbi:hypothetical protein Tco_0150274 [Tanacetum coccineum]